MYLKEVRENKQASPAEHARGQRRPLFLPRRTQRKRQASPTEQPCWQRRPLSSAQRRETRNGGAEDAEEKQASPCEHARGQRRGGRKERPRALAQAAKSGMRRESVAGAHHSSQCPLKQDRIAAQESAEGAWGVVLYTPLRRACDSLAKRDGLQSLS
jgi:hypothetical protein